MGFMGQTISISLYRVIGRLPKKDLEEWMAERLRRNRFQAIEGATTEKARGWVCLDDPNDATFENYRLFIRPPYVCFSLRTDERKIAPALLRNRFDLECRKWLAGHPDFKWVPRQRKTELQELVRQRLLAKTLAVPSGFDIVWHTQTGRVMVGSLSLKDLEAFEGQAKNSFSDVGLEALHPMALARNLLNDGDGGKLDGLNKSSGQDVVDQIKENRWLGQEFLLWLLHASETTAGEFTVRAEGPGALGELFEARVDSRVVLDGGAEDPRKVTVTGSQAAYREVREALRNDLQPAEATLYMLKDEEAWKLTLKGETFRFGSFKTPKVHIERDELTDETDEREAVFYERMHLLESGFQMFESLLQEFLELRLSRRWSERLSAMRAWQKSRS